MAKRVNTIFLWQLCDLNCMILVQLPPSLRRVGEGAL